MRRHFRPKMSTGDGFILHTKTKNAEVEKYFCESPSLKQKKRGEISQRTTVKENLTLI